MFHVKQLREDYIRQVKAWDRVHRLIGRERFESLLGESEEALQSLDPTLTTLVDIGAGSGVLGAPWLWLGGSEASRKLVFVEPDPKKAAFLVTWQASLPNTFREQVLVLGQRFENVPRETIDRFAQDRRVFVARAFAGDCSFVEACRNSRFAEENFFTFEKAQGKKAVLKPIILNGGT